MRLHLIRHGLSKANVDSSVYLTDKDHLITLTEEGERQASLAGKTLKAKSNLKPENTHVYVSPYKRTRQTWELISQELGENLFVTESPIIREQEYKIFKDLEEMKMKKDHRNDFGPFWYRYKNAESTADVYGRIMTFMNHLMAQSAIGRLKDDDNVVVVTHEVVIRMFVMILKSLTPENAKIDIGNAEVLVFDLDKTYKVLKEYKLSL